MSGTIVEYLGYQRAPFSEVPLNDVDSLVLSTIAYFNFEKGAVGRCVPADRVPLPVALCGVPRDELYEGIWLSRMGGEEFTLALLQSPRFMDLSVGYFANEVSAHFEKQFAAVTFFFPDGSCYVAFRGTDNSLAGWKEDFNITFMSETPSQVSARTYLEDIAGLDTARLYVGGHSKGGNLAEYAALTCREQTFAKLEGVFNHDGPGFAFQPSERIGAPEYARKLSKTVPEASVFGMLVEDRDVHRIVKATGFLFAQHASTHWLVEGSDFVTASALSPDAELIDASLNKWAIAYEPAQRELLIDAFYDVFSSTDAESWADFKEDPGTRARAVLEAAARQSPQVRSTVLGMLRDVAGIFGAEALRLALGGGQVEEKP